MEICDLPDKEFKIMIIWKAQWDRNYKKASKQVLELKYTIIQVKNSVESFSIILKQKKELVNSKTSYWKSCSQIIKIKINKKERKRLQNWNGTIMRTSVCIMDAEQMCTLKCICGNLSPSVIVLKGGTLRRW